MEKPAEIKVNSVIVRVPISEIKLNPNNRNKHPKAQIDRLAELFRFHGMRTPLIVSKQSGIVIAGEGRYLAAKKGIYAHRYRSASPRRRLHRHRRARLVTEQIIDELRDTLKRELLRAAKYRPVCPVSGQNIAHTASLHEIVCPPLGGRKYHPQNRELAAAVFVRENCLLLSPEVNVNTANSLRAEFASTADDEVWAVDRHREAARHSTLFEDTSGLHGSNHHVRRT